MSRMSVDDENATCMVNYNSAADEQGECQCSFSLLFYLHYQLLIRFVFLKCRDSVYISFQFKFNLNVFCILTSNQSIGSKLRIKGMPHEKG